MAPLTPWQWAFVGWVGVSSLGWLWVHLSGTCKLYRLKGLHEWGEAPEPRAWPRLSVIVPARDEAATLGPALQTLLQQDYPALEIIVVDDRSTDGTAEIVDRIAAADPRVKALHIRALPDAWMGKVHALQSGVAQASGEWLLLTDADVRFGAGVLRRAVAIALRDNLDHLSLHPLFESDGFWHRTATEAFTFTFMYMLEIDKIEDPSSEAYAGIGAFNLVRRTALERSEGLSWLRMEIVDDVGLGLLLKRAGARSRVGTADRELSVRWYASLGAMARGLEKNLFPPLSHLSFARAFAMIGLYLVIACGPFAGLSQPTLPSFPLAVAALCGQLLFGVIVSTRRHRALWPHLALPIGQLLCVYFQLRSTCRYLRDGGATWRGDHYPIALLRKYQRVKLPLRL